MFLLFVDEDKNSVHSAEYPHHTPPHEYGIPYKPSKYSCLKVEGQVYWMPSRISEIVFFHNFYIMSELHHNWIKNVRKLSEIDEMSFFVITLLTSYQPTIIRYITLKVIQLVIHQKPWKFLTKYFITTIIIVSSLQLSSW